MCDTPGVLQARYQQCKSFAEAPLIVVIGKQSSSLYSHDGQQQWVRFPVGYEQIVTRFFSHEPPTPAEVEYAINYIEDELELIARQIATTPLTLFSGDAALAEIATLCKVPSGDHRVLPRDAVERLFGRYAEASMNNRYVANELITGAQFYAQLLILREILHHLKFEQIHLVNFSR